MSPSISSMSGFSFAMTSASLRDQDMYALPSLSMNTSGSMPDTPCM